MKQVTKIELPKNTIVKIILWVFPSVIAVCTWLIMNRINDVLDALKAIPDLATKIQLHEQRFVTDERAMNEYKGQFKELEILVGTKEDKIEVKGRK